ncbi:MAG: YlxR family protein [Actinomycetota bacterium]|nr:YlxR family protein [Actinomycetota bacterium]
MTEPCRTCVGCRRRRAQSGLRRVALDADRRLVWDLARQQAGRGAWLCADTLGTCFDAARKKKAFGRALRHALDPADLDRMAAGLVSCGLPDPAR